MSVTTDKLSDLKEQMKLISKETTILKAGKKDAIELDPRNKFHRDWYKGR